MKKIILGGGWGYGNIGDDLILSSTIETINNIKSDTHYTVLTYSKSDSLAHINTNVELAYTLHRNIDFNNTKYTYTTYNEARTLYCKVMQRVTKQLADSERLSNYKLNKNKNDFNEIVNSSDLYIMCGGGYFNEKWVSKIRAQLNELDLAQKAGLKTAVIGPTIGNIPSQLKSLAKQVFKNTDLITVRDEASKATLLELGVQAEVISDIAMSCWEVEAPKSEIEEIGIVYTSGASKLIPLIVEGLVKYNEQKNGNIKFNFIITRRWKMDFESAQLLMNALLEKGINSKLIIPSDHISLENEMANFDLVISENLHGLISASRNLIPVIAINDYPPESPNWKKFIGFLKQFDIESHYINQNSEKGVLKSLINQIENNYMKITDNLALKRQITSEKYNLKLKEFIG